MGKRFVSTLTDCARVFRQRRDELDAALAEKGLEFPTHDAGITNEDYFRSEEVDGWMIITVTRYGWRGKETAKNLATKMIVHCGGYHTPSGGDRRRVFVFTPVEGGNSPGIDTDPVGEYKVIIKVIEPPKGHKPMT